MADDGLPSSYKFAPAPTPPATPASTPQATAPAAPTGLPSSYKPAPAPAAPPAPAPAQGPPGYLNSTGATGGVPAQPPQSGWGIDWSTPWSQGGPSLRQPQGFQDWDDVAKNEAAMDSLPDLRARADAARQRLGPLAATADAFGSAVSPSQILNAIPVAGPAVAGGVHEGVKSYMTQPDWVPTGKNLEKVVGDTSAGFIEGEGAGTAAKLAPAVLPQLTKWGLKAGPIGYGTKLLHDAFGSVGADVAGGIGLFGVVNKASDWAGEQMKSLASSPVTQQAIRSVILGGGSAARNYAGPYDQWITGQ